MNEEGDNMSMLECVEAASRNRRISKSEKVKTRGDRFQKMSRSRWRDRRGEEGIQRQK